MRADTPHKKVLGPELSAVREYGFWAAPFTHPGNLSVDQMRNPFPAYRSKTINGKKGFFNIPGPVKNKGLT